MKVVKLLPALCAASLLAACSTASQSTAAPAKEMKSEVPEMVMVQPKRDIGRPEKVTYTCSVSGKKQKLTATYIFDGDKPEAASISLGKKVLAKQLKVDTKYQDGTQFTDGKNVWSLSANVTSETVKNTAPVMLYTKGKTTDKIIAKNCDVVAAK